MTRSRCRRSRLVLAALLRTPPAVALLAGAAALASCERTVEPTEVLPPLQPTSLDADAGTWRMLVLSGPAQMRVPAPAPTTSDAYRAELDAIKAAQARMTGAQREALRYWSGGGVLRWNQITRELVARFELPPARGAGGNFPAPDPGDPHADPKFPFANPRHAALAYSYVSVAQYEALKAAWHWKFAYNRPSPARVDAAVSAFLPTSDLPAYPSEDAVLSAVTAEVLRLLFPAAAEDITKRATEQCDAALLSGRAAPSDIAAGLALGRTVAAAVIARGEEPWVSRERLALQWKDGAGTTTPPGHWNDIASEYIRDARMSEVRAARAFALLNMAMRDAGPSTLSAASATVLAYLFPDGGPSFDAMAAEAGISRPYGGIHHRSDIEQGRAHGARIGSHVVEFARADGAR